jgi:hypothetical protein
MSTEVELDVILQRADLSPIEKDKLAYEMIVKYAKLMLEAKQQKRLDG